MKQPKDDDRPLVLSKKITKGQHIIPAKIIEKWKQKDKDGRLKLLTQIKFTPKSDPKIQWFSDERRDDFCVYHRWVQKVEKQKTDIENDFYTLVSECESECEKLQSDIVAIDSRDQKNQEIVLNYFSAIMMCNYLKYPKNNSYIEMKLQLSDVDEQIRQRQLQNLDEDNNYREDWEISGCAYLDAHNKVDISDMAFLSNVYQRTRFYVYMNKDDPRAIWYYIKTKERLYLPDCYKPCEEMNNENVGIINVSPHSILISRYFIDTYLRRIAEANHFDLSQLDIVNPPADCKNVISFVKIINSIALKSYDKWLIH